VAAIEPSPTAEATRLLEPRRIPGGEDARQAGLERERWTLQRPAARWVSESEVAAGEQEAAVVALNIGG
jgi:hypothetical protein